MSALRIGELFSGYGGLGMGVQSVLGGDIAWHSEIDPGACKILAHRYPDVPNHGDVIGIDWPAVEPVDVLTLGFPCQDVSSAGLRKGLHPGTRSGLWSHAAFAINQLRPRLVVIENVRGLLSAEAHHPAHRDHFHPAGGAVEPCPWCVGDPPSRPLRALGAVLGDLADAGFDAEWVGLRAADIGAPHGRFRVFIAAWDTSGAAWGGPELGDLRARLVAAAEPGEPARSAAAHPADDGRERGRPSRHGRDGSADHGHAAADTDRDALREQPVGLAGRSGTPVAGHAGVEWGSYEPAIRRWERVLGRVAPAPTELGAKGNARLSPAFVEWMQGLPAGWVTDVPGLSRNEQLKALGNGVVSQQAAAALRMLLPDALEAAA